MIVKTILPTTKVPVIIETTDNRHFQVTGDTSKHDGCMRFTSEWNIRFIIKKNGDMKFSGGWEIASSEINYSATDGYELFEHRHPGILTDIYCFIKDNTDMFMNQTK